MVWQDLVVAAANVLFGYSLVFQAYIGFREKKGFIKLQTSVFTMIGLYALSVSFFTLGLYISTVVAFFNGTMWLIIAVQRVFYRKA